MVILHFEPWKKYEAVLTEEEDEVPKVSWHCIYLQPALLCTSSHEEIVVCADIIPIEQIGMAETNYSFGQALKLGEADGSNRSSAWCTNVSHVDSWVVECIQ